MVETTGRYLGDLRVLAAHGPSGAEITTDAPVDNEGLGRNFSPTDLMGAALGTSILTILGIVARRREIDIRGARYRIEKEMVADPKRRIAKLTTTIWLPASLSEDDRRVLEQAAHGCPVHHSLDPRIEAPVEVLYE